LDARFRDRADAGKQLAEKLSKYSARGDVIVLALPRGGVPVAYEVAKALNAPLDVFLVRKIGLPSHEEFAMGAIASGGTVLINDEVTRTYGVSQQHVDAAIARERSELERREREYRGPRKLPDLRGRTVILVDDGLATGASMRAAAAAVRALGPARIVVAVPIAPAETCEVLREEADEVVCALTPEPFYAVGLWYQDFAQMTDSEVTELLERGRRELPATASPRET
jgi:putative phosphoribosyl transferase